MSDKHLTIADFRYGLDARKSQLTSRPGTLEICENARINGGGEAEKRKAFVKDAVNYVESTFGLQDTDEGLVTFGSEGDPGTLPAGVTYQQLPHPEISAEPSGDETIENIPTRPPMVRVVHSDNYLGKAFVIAEYANGNVLMFYNSVLIAQSLDGLVWDAGSASLAVLGATLTDIVNRFSGWSAINNLDGTVTVKSPAGIHFSPEIEETSVSGQLGAKLIDQNVSGQASVSAAVAFTINAGTDGTVQVQAPANSDGTGVAELTGGTVAWELTAAATAADIVAAINERTFITGYSAYGVGATVTVNAPAEFGNFTFDLTVTTTGDITTVAGTVTPLFSIQASPSGLNVELISATSRSVSGKISIIVTGASAPGNVTYQWTETNADGSLVTTPSGILISLRSTDPTLTFGKYLAPNTSVQGYWKCVATDSVGPVSATVYVSINLSLDNLL